MVIHTGLPNEPDSRDQDIFSSKAWKAEDSEKLRNVFQRMYWSVFRQPKIEINYSPYVSSN